MIGVIDYKIGNTGSILNMLRRLHIQCKSVITPSECFECDKLILPGVGAFDHGMKMLEQNGFIDTLQRIVSEEHIYILGICLGAQMMTRQSDEGKLKGLGWFPADTVRFFSNGAATTRKVPHMGWTDIDIKKESALFHPEEQDRFYFVHSFHFHCDNPSIVLATAVYGYEFPAILSQGKLIGAQFHPEKSHRFGMRLLQRFASLP